MNWATSVFPEFTITSRSCQTRETARKNRHEIQIGTTPFRPPARIVIGLASKQNHVQRTLVLNGTKFVNTTVDGLKQFADLLISVKPLASSIAKIADSYQPYKEIDHGTCLYA